MKTTPARRDPIWTLLMADWGKQCRRIRQQTMGESQAQFGDRIGVAQSVVSDVELGKYRSLTPEMMIRFAVGLETEPAELFTFPRWIIEPARADVRVVAA